MYVSMCVNASNGDGCGACVAANVCSEVSRGLRGDRTVCERERERERESLSEKDRDIEIKRENENENVCERERGRERDGEKERGRDKERERERACGDENPKIFAHSRLILGLTVALAVKVEPVLAPIFMHSAKTVTLTLALTT